MFMLVSSAQARVYKWVDENGKVHYGDKPASNKADEVKIRKHSYTGSSDQPASRAELQKRFLRARQDERNEKNKAKAKAKQKRAEKKVKCAKAKKEANRYRDASSIYVKGKDGERNHLSFKEREAYEKSLAADVKKWCGR